MYKICIEFEIHTKNNIEITQKKIIKW